jgi:GT2 family glycosyltransferase
MKVFAIIVTYNGMKWIQECLKSVSYSSIPIKIIVIDNCSTDGTVNFIKSNFKEIILLEQNGNLGFGKANNIGISFALKESSDYVFLLNQDAFVMADTIEKLIATAQQNQEYGIISPIHTNASGTVLDQSFLYYTRNSGGSGFLSDFVLNRIKKDIYSLPMINAAAWLIPKTTLEVVGGFDPMFFLYGEDDNYCQRVLYHQLQIGIVPEVFIRHDSDNNYVKPIKKGSKKYYDKFLNSVKVRYGNVNNDYYKDLGKLTLYLRNQSLLSLLKFDLENYTINRTKMKLVSDLNLKRNVLFNRKKGRNNLSSD